MSDNTHIHWADATWNISTGCSKVSPGCKGCYMYREYPRLKRMGLASYQAAPNVVTLVPGLMDQPLRWKRSRRIFPCSMSDICHEDIPDEYFYTALAIAALASWHDFLFLTKRAERMMKLFLAGPEPVEAQIEKHLEVWPLTKQQKGNIRRRQEKWLPLIQWPLPNVWPGVSVENEDYTWRLDCLVQIPAVVRWISYEPALGPLSLNRWLGFKNGAHQEIRRCCLRCGYQWRVGDRLTGAGVASGSEEGRPLEWGSESHTLPPQASGTPGQELSPGPSDVQWSEVLRSSPQASLSPFLRPHTGESGDQSQERNARRQSPREPRAQHHLREPDSPHLPGQLRPVGGEESPGQTERCPSCGDTATALRGGTTYLDSQGLWRVLPDHLKDSTASAPLISWCVYGGESGPGARAPNPYWFRQVRDECLAAGVAQHFKQWGEFSPTGGELIAMKRRSATDTHAYYTFRNGRTLRRQYVCHHFPAPDEFVYDVGRFNAGRLLDGVQWDEYPDP